MSPCLTMSIQTVPDILPIAERIVGSPYEQYNCWDLCRYLYHEGWGEELDEKPESAWRYVAEIWWQDDLDDPLELMKPWDLLIMRGRGMASHHTGVVCNAVHFVHTRKRVGTCLEPLRRWTPRLLQIARLRRLL